VASFAPVDTSYAFLDHQGSHFPYAGQYLWVRAFGMMVVVVGFDCVWEGSNMESDIGVERRSYPF